MKQNIAVLIDGGHLRSYARKAKKLFVPDYMHARSISFPAPLADNHQVPNPDMKLAPGQVCIGAAAVKAVLDAAAKQLCCDTLCCPEDAPAFTFRRPNLRSTVVPMDMRKGTCFRGRVSGTVSASRRRDARK